VVGTGALSRRQLLRLAALATVGAPAFMSGGSASAAVAVPSSDVTSQLLQRLPVDHLIVHGPAHRPNVAITIDDWWFTSDCLQYLETTLNLGKTHNAQFTFFPVGAALRDAWEGRPTEARRLWRRAAAEGHVIGNHTQTHDPLSTMSTSRIDWELREQHRWVERVLGARYEQHLMRPPGGDGGFSSQGKLFDHTLGAVRDLGYYLTMWSIDSNASDGSIVTADEDSRFLAKILSQVDNGSIILVHPTTLSAQGLVTLVGELRRRQFHLVTVPDLFAPAEYWV
jgi:peptidoglycan/xylan/chitin deacetylase (PgdA/CDA1 family)